MALRRALFVVLLLQAACSIMLITRPGIDNVLAAASIGVLTLVAAWALWSDVAAFPYIALSLLSFDATIDLAALSRGESAPLVAAALALGVAAAAMIFDAPFVLDPATVTAYERALFLAVFAFAIWVAGWDLLAPAQSVRALPFVVPPLHARFLGAMYLAGSVFMLLAVQARTWSEIRVTTSMLALWTGGLGLVSMVHLGAFDFGRTQVWCWFFAYICFPAIALWILWKRRAQRAPARGRPLPRGARRYLTLLGTVAVVLALLLLVVPSLMASVWPWPITPLLANIYGAPFFAYGAGSLYAARQRTWSEVRYVLYGTATFAIGVIVASILHAKLFNIHAIATWVWFVGFGLASLCLLALIAASNGKDRPTGRLPRAAA